MSPGVTPGEIRSVRRGDDAGAHLHAAAFIGHERVFGAMNDQHRNRPGRLAARKEFAAHCRRHYGNRRNLILKFAAQPLRIVFFCAKREGPEWQQVVSEYHGPEFVRIACNDKSPGKSRRYLPLQNGMGLAYGPDVTTRLQKRDEIVTKQRKVVTGRSV
ncbi:MAG: hypothetical protein DMG09_02435 [Acidobacteria bacterium]|nr:MAG: hypothetical protein DMG09_02435 [Acidobacteriota bacterium]